MRVKIILTTAVLSLLFGMMPAFGSENAFTPSIAVSEEYTDNVYESNSNQKEDFITRVMPGIALMYMAPFWDWDIAYNYDYRYYVHRSRTDDSTHNLLGTGQIRLLENFMYLDLNDTYSRVSLNIARDRAQESLFLNQSDSNTFSVSPYFVFHPGSKMTTKTGYRYVNVWYKDPTGIDRRDHVGFMDSTYVLSPKFNLTANYSYTHENSINSFDRHDPSIGFRYDYRDGSFVLGQGGYTWFSSRTGGATNNPFWNVALTHTFEHYSITAATGVQYPYDPQSGITRETDYSLAINKVLNRGTIGLSLSYSRFSGDVVDINKRYGTGLTARYNLTEKLHATLSCNLDKYVHSAANSTTTRLVVNPALNYSLPLDVILALNYTYIEATAPGNSTDNLRVNRVALEVRKSFGRVLEKHQPKE